MIFEIISREITIEPFRSAFQARPVPPFSPHFTQRMSQNHVQSKGFFRVSAPSNPLKLRACYQVRSAGSDFSVRIPLR